MFNKNKLIILWHRCNKKLVAVVLILFIFSVGYIFISSNKGDASTERLISQDKPTTASTNTKNFEARKANDGNLDTYWSANTRIAPQWWSVDLGSRYHLTRIKIAFRNSASTTYKYKVEISTDGMSYMPVTTKVSATTAVDDILNRQGRYVKVTVANSSSGVALVNEIKIWGKTIVTTQTNPTTKTTDSSGKKSTIKTSSSSGKNKTTNNTNSSGKNTTTDNANSSNTPGTDPVTYSVKPSGVDDTATIQAIVSARGTSGGKITFAPGTYTVSSPIKLPAGNTALLTLSGYNTTVRLTNATPRFLVWDRTSMHQTFRKFLIEGFNIDARNNHPASGTWSVLGFDMKSGSDYYESGYLNIEEITIKDDRVYNVATSATSTWNAIDIHVGVAHWGDESTTNHINDILVQGCRLEGGERGVNINGYGYTPSATNITLDRIYIRDCWHDTMVNPIQFGASTNYHVGQSGRLGTVEITNSYGNRSFDCGVEIDQASNGLVQNTTIENATTTNYYYTHFNSPLSGAGLIVFDSNTARSNLLPAPGYQSMGYVVGYEGLPIGVVKILNSRHDIGLSGYHESILVPNVVNHVDWMDIDGYILDAPNATTGTYNFIALRGVFIQKTLNNITIYDPTHPHPSGIKIY